MRAVSACAAIPQARNATSTTAANGFADHDPNDETTAVVTGSTSLPGDDRGRVRVRERRRRPR